MNTIYRILVILLLALLCVAIIYTAVNPGSSVLKICPVNAITQSNNIAVIDSQKCINCGRCFKGIPNPLDFYLTQRKNDAITKDVIADNQSTPQPNSVDNNNATTVKQPVTSSGQDKLTKTETSDKRSSKISSLIKTFYKVNSDTCIGCQLCASNCPTNAITMQNGKAVIDPEKCTACGICANGNGNDFSGCPTTAISKVSEKLTRNSK